MKVNPVTIDLLRALADKFFVLALIRQWFTMVCVRRSLVMMFMCVHEFHL